MHGQTTERSVHKTYDYEVFPGLLRELAERFKSYVMSEYYDWNYYRVSNHTINNSNIVFDNETLYYIELPHATTEQPKRIMQLTYDGEDQEALLEEYLNLSLANMTDCNGRYLDAYGNQMMCYNRRNYDSIFIHSTKEGLVDVEETAYLRPLIFPNGRILFYDLNTSYDETLGDEPRHLYQINADGTLAASSIELSIGDDVCESHGCFNRVDATFINEAGEPIPTYNDAS